MLVKKRVIFFSLFQLILVYFIYKNSKTEKLVQVHYNTNATSIASGPPFKRDTSTSMTQRKNNTKLQTIIKKASLQC